MQISFGLPVKAIAAVSLLTFVVSQTAVALDGDIIPFAKDHPAGISYADGRPIDYGDPRMAKAVQELSDISRPWTVLKMVLIFSEESDAWLRKLHQRTADRKTTMWDTWRQESNRCGYLATVLAASRDPRAAVALGKALNTPDFPDGIRVIEGLYYYFLPDSHYKQLPPETDGPKASTNFYPEMTRQVKEWWSLNKEQIAIEARSLPAPAKSSRP